MLRSTLFLLKVLVVYNKDLSSLLEVLHETLSQVKALNVANVNDAKSMKLLLANT